MKYIETKGLPVINWFDEINEMKRLTDLPRVGNNRFYEKLQELSRLSKEWVTCACGNQCSVIPRQDNGAPKDGWLEDLGMGFYQAIKRWKWDRALEYLFEIEKRSGYLIQNVYVAPQPLAAIPMILL